MSVTEDVVVVPDSEAPSPPDRSQACPGSEAGSETVVMPPRRRRRWRPVLGAIVVILMLAVWSYVGYLRSPGYASWQQRSVEWIRDHGGDPVVDRFEQWWYSRHRPGDGEPESAALPAIPTPVEARGAGVDGSRASTAPADIQPLAPDPIEAEGRWRPGVQAVEGHPVLYTTFLRPDAQNTSVLAGIVWFDQRLLRAVAVPGTREPGGSGWAWSSGIPPAQRRTLVAAFNSGFRFRHIDGGYFTEGRMPEPLVDGQASLTIDPQGRIDVVEWGRDATVGSDVVSVRQNLHLIVDDGRPVAGLRTNTDGLWGKRHHQLQYTWRSGVGVTDDGDVVVVAGDKLSLTALAEALSRAGAVRGMQMDIHTDQVAVNLFQPEQGTDDGVVGTKLLPGMPTPTTRFLAPDQRDFFALFVR